MVCWAAYVVRSKAVYGSERPQTCVNRGFLLFAGMTRGLVFTRRYQRYGGLCCFSPSDRGAASKSLSFELQMNADQKCVHRKDSHITPNRSMTKHQISNIEGMSKRTQWFGADPSAAWRRSAGGRVRSPCCLLEGEIRQCDSQFAADMARMSTRRAIRDRPCLTLQVPPVGPTD